MTKPLTDEQLDVALTKSPIGPGRAVIEQVRKDLAAMPAHTIRMSPELATNILREFDAWLEIGARLAAEARAFRDNVQLQRDRPPSRYQTCTNCRFFQAVRSPAGHTPPDPQAIVQNTGACSYGPPAAMQRGNAGQFLVVSMFPPVHPDQWCGRWEASGNRKVSLE